MRSDLSVAPGTRPQSGPQHGLIIRRTDIPALEANEKAT